MQKMKKVKLDEVVAAVLQVLPDAIFEEDMQGQIVIYTGCMEQCELENGEEISYLIPFPEDDV